MISQGPYIAKIGAIWLSLSELEENDIEAKKLKNRDRPEDWEDVEDIV